VQQTIDGDAARRGVVDDVLLDARVVGEEVEGQRLGVCVHIQHSLINALNGHNLHASTHTS
jgi:hypothetical protein